MTEGFVKPAFQLDPPHIRILQTISDRPGCRISHVVQTLLSEYGENSVRSKVHQLLVNRYVSEVKSAQEIQLRITGKGRAALQISDGE